MTLIDESSPLQTLYRSTVRAFPKTKKRQHVVDSVRVDKLSFETRRKAGKLVVRGRTSTVDPETGETTNYRQTIRFESVVYADKPTSGHVHIQEGIEHHWVQPIDVNKVDVHVRCSCPDFKYRFMNVDKVDDSLFGKDSAGKPRSKTRPANPKKLPGACKHVIRIGEEIDRRHLLTGKINPAKVKRMVEDATGPVLIGKVVVR